MHKYLKMGLVLCFFAGFVNETIFAARSVDDSEKVEFWLEKAYAAKRAERFQEALDALIQARLIDQYNAEVRLELGNVYIDLGNIAEALRIWEKLVEEYPSNFALKNNLAWLYATTEDDAVKNPSRALAYVKEAMLQAPMEYQIWNTLAESYQGLGEYNKAAHAAARALELAKNNDAPAEDITMCEYLARKYAKLADAVTHDDMAEDDVAYWTNVGQYELKRGRLAAALGAFSLARTHNPDDRAARFGEATVYIQIKKFEKGIALLEELAAEYPNDYAIKNNLAWIYATAEDFSVRDGKKAVEMAQSALMLAPNDYHVWSTLAEAYFMAGDYEKALRSAESALQQARLNSASKREVAAYQAQADKCKKASEAMSLLE